LEALAKIDSTTLVEVQLHTGRTHQIRVHFSALKHPVVGDALYGAASKLCVGKTTLPPLGTQFSACRKARLCAAPDQRMDRSSRGVAR